MLLPEARFNPEKVSNVSMKEGSNHRKINYDLCTAINLTKLGIVIDDMVAAGMNPQLAELYKTNAMSLLQLMRSENNRIHDL